MKVKQKEIGKEGKSKICVNPVKVISFFLGDLEGEGDRRVSENSVASGTKFPLHQMSGRPSKRSVDLNKGKNHHSFNVAILKDLHIFRPSVSWVRPSPLTV